MKVFITGVAGFLGSQIAASLLERGDRVAGCDNLIGGYLDNVPQEVEFHQVDCCYLSTMKNLMKDCDAVIHTACTAYEGLSVFSPHLVTQNTYQISSTVYSAVSSCTHVKKIINCSSMARYGEQNSYPFTEDMRPAPVDPYGISKAAAEELMKSLAGVHGFKYVNLVPHNIIGPNQKYDDPFRNVASIMINLMLRGKQPIIYGDGEQVRCFSDIRDVVPCFLRALDDPAVEGETINIGPDEEFVTINELALQIADVTGFKNLRPLYMHARPAEVRYAACCSDKARKLLDYRTNYSLRESLEYLASWIKMKGPKKFRYNLDIEIVNDKCPRAWTEKLFE